MTLTWQPKSTRAAGLVGRILAFAFAAFICTMLTYLAFSQRLGVITDLFEDGVVIDTYREEPPPAPPIIPPRAQQPPPQTQRETPADSAAPLVPTFEPIATETAEITPPGPVYINATFLQRPSGRDFERYFPRRALERAVSGRVVLDCTVAANGRLACAVASETPSGWGFGEASLRAAQQFRVAPATADGRPTSGGRISVPMTWQVR